MDIEKIARIGFRVIVALAAIYGVFWLILIKGESSHMDGTNVSLIITYILAGVAVLATLVAAGGGILNAPKTSFKFLIGIGALVLIAVIGYNVSSGDVLVKWEEGGVTSEGGSRFVDSGLYLLYGVLGITLAGILVSEVISFIKN